MKTPKNKDTGRDMQLGTDNIIEHDERMVPEFHKGNEIYGEHISRYEAVKQLVANKIVLDIASGSGYGTAQMSTSAKKIYGVDISENAINYASVNFGAKNIEYLVGDGDNIPLPSESVDIATSFETIEHIPDYEKFVDEVNRVIKPGGIFVVSTPNDLEFTKGNHFHLHQFTEKELVALLKKRFKYVKSYYQTTWLFSLIGDDKTFSKEWKSSVSVMQTSPISDQNVLYFYFLCSNQPIKESINPLGAIGEHWSERKIREKESLTTQHIKNIEDQLAAAQKFVKEQAELISVLQESAVSWKSKVRHFIKNKNPRQ